MFPGLSPGAARRQRRVAIACLAMLVMLPANACAATEIAAVRVALAPDRVRLVLESSSAIHARVVYPNRPGAVLIDLGDLGNGAKGAVLGQLITRLGAGTSYLQALRIVHGEGGRVAIELISTAAITPQMFNLKPGDGHGDRLVVDVYPEQWVNPSPRPQAGSDGAATGSSEIAKATAVPAAPLPTSAPAPDALAEAWLEVHVNDELVGTALVLQDAAHHVLVRGEDLEQWRIRATKVSAVHHGVDLYYPLDAITGLGYRVDEAHQTLLLTVAAGLFDATALSGRSRGLIEPARSPFGAYLNYDVFADRPQQGRTSGSAFLESSVFGRWGSGTGTVLARNLDGHTQVIRLDTTWVDDRPASMASLRLGDDISGASGWGRPVRFGGVQWATNFATQPTFITFPMPTLGGTAATPSTVDFYVNNALRLRRNVPSGPFSIQDLPVVTGQGEIRLVVRDVLGREQTVTQPFYASGGLLADGLHDYSYEIGFERHDYALQSNDYGRLMAVGTERMGLSDTFTGELHAELLRGQQTIGMGGTYLWSTAGVVTASMAASRGAAGSGELVSLGFQRQSGYLSYGVRTQFTSPGFVQLGYEPEALPPRQTTTAFAGLGVFHSSMGISYTHQDFRDAPDVELAGANYSRSVGRLGYLTLSVLRFLSGGADTLFSLSLTMPLGERSSASFNGQAHAGSSQATLQLQRSLPTGDGMGYRLQTGLSSSDPRQAGISLQNEVDTYAFDVAQDQHQREYRGSVQGGISLLDGKFFFSRRIDDSFAVVQVPGYANVRVYADNQQVASTDAHGYALVPRLRPYQVNPIRIEQADLPLDARIDGLQLDAVPYQHGALMLRFPVTRARGAILTIMLPGGAFLPAGAQVTVAGNPEVFPVGMRGEVYLTGLAELNPLHVAWQGQGCDLVVRFHDTTDPLPHLGPVTCPGIKP